MAFNGSGTFVINSAGQPVVPNTVISATVFNALTADLATGLSTCITKDGQTTPTANIPMGTYKFTGLGNGSAATDSATLGQVQASTTKLVTVTGTDTLTGTLSPVLTAYASGQMFYFVAGATNTGAVTLNIDSLGAKSVTRHGSVALVAGDILSGEVCVVLYDGTRFQLLNPTSYTNLNVTGTLSAGSVSYTGTLTGGTGIVNIGSGQFYKDASGNLGIGTASPSVRLQVEGGAASNIVAIRGSAEAGSALLYTVNANASATQWYVGHNSSDVDMGNLRAGALKFFTNSSERMRIDSAGNIVAGASAALATTATDGFLYVPTCAGTPTGTPTAITGMAPLVVNTTNNKLYFYSGGAWRDAGP